MIEFGQITDFQEYRRFSLNRSHPHKLLLCWVSDNGEDGSLIIGKRLNSTLESTTEGFKSVGVFRSLSTSNLKFEFHFR